MKLKIVEVPDSLLKEKSIKVEKITPEIKTLIDDMIETMYSSNGIGLAAVQVGKLLKIVVLDVEQKENSEKKPQIFINPEITFYSPEKEMMEEGCLSVPEQRASVLRSLKVKVKYQDIDMNEKEIEADGLLAHCLQHEIDHTNGIVYIDYLSKLKRDKLLRHLDKKRRQKQEEEAWE